MPKNIVICSDGTGNSAIKGRGTNVFKLYEAVDLHNSSTEQVAIYDDGVGTQSFKLFKILGGAFGFGLSRNVRQLYTELVRVYEPGDQISLFGFSRGAFTVRTLCGFITTCGILKRDYQTDGELNRRVKKAFRVYRRARKYAVLECIYLFLIGSWLQVILDFVLEKTIGWIPAFGFSRNNLEEHLTPEHVVFDNKYCPKGVPRVRFVGVWDTVSAVGFPLLCVSNLINALVYHFKFPDYKLSDKVDKACHALAIDDQRATFHPLMWEHAADDKRVEQVWFSGVHANVGGGYPKQGVSLVSMDWMMERAHDDGGLKFIDGDRNTYQKRQNVHGKVYDSRAGLAHYYRYLPRRLDKICEGKTPVYIHESVFQRINHTSDAYYPCNIPREFTVVATDPKKKVKQFKDIVAKQLGDNDSCPLDKAEPWNLIRILSNYGFVILTLAAVYWAMKEEIATQGIGKTLYGLFSGSGLMSLFKNIITEPWIIGVIVLFLLIGWICKGFMRSIFSKFWLPIQAQLK